MKVVISCAGSKVAHAGRMKTADGKPVEFVAQPDEVTNRDDVVYVHPDDVVDDGLAWRKKLVVYNQKCADAEPLGLLPAYELYCPRKPYSDLYKRLVEVFKIENVYILSAGWGLVRASFRLPKYDITFSSNSGVARHKRRFVSDRYCDFNQLDKDTSDDLLFFGDKDYHRSFCEITENYGGRRIAYFNLKKEPHHPGVEFVRFESSNPRIGHYVCAKRCAELFRDDPASFDPLKLAP